MEKRYLFSAAKEILGRPLDHIKRMVDRAPKS